MDVASSRSLLDICARAAISALLASWLNCCTRCSMVPDRKIGKVSIRDTERAQCLMRMESEGQGFLKRLWPFLR